MHRTATLACLLLASLVLVLLAAEQDATDKAMEKIVSLKDQGFVNIRGERRGYLAEKADLSQKIKLFGGQDYLAVVAGDEDLEQVKLVVQDAKGAEVASGGGDGPLASITFTPAAQDKYTFLVQAPGKGGYYHFALVTK